MSKGEFVLNKEGVREMLRSDEIKAVCRKYAENMAESLGTADYGVSDYKGKNRVNVSLRAKSKKAAQDNLDNNTMLKAVRK